MRKETPLIILTSKFSSVERVMGIIVGYDTYLT
jgi:DNA-binding response OmpR family regulator